MMNEDCFAYVHDGRHRCEALEENLCKDGYCPFYKKKAQLQKDIEKARKRNERMLKKWVVD